MTDETYTLADLPYDPGALEPHISGRIMEVHHDEHHATYIEGANTAVGELAQARTGCDPATSSMLERDIAFHVSRHVLHSVSWTVLSPDDGGEPTGPFGDELAAIVGGSDVCRQQMTEAAGTVQGSGWALTSREPTARRLVVQQVHDQQGEHGQGTIPLLAIDAWEHAHYLRCESNKACFEAIRHVIDGSDVERPFAVARPTDLVPAT